jgi:hypothetical protein
MDVCRQYLMGWPIDHSSSVIKKKVLKLVDHTVYINIPHHFPTGSHSTSQVRHIQKVLVDG